MKKLLTTYYLLLTVSIALITSCQTQETPSLSEHSNQSLELKSSASSSMAEFTVLGKRKVIPCSVSNMRQAYQSLIQNPTATLPPNGTYSINATHYYYKFLPKDSLQFEILDNDSVLSVSDIPFEYEVLTEGDKYQDPALVGTDFTYYYAVVPINYPIPAGIQYEIIAQLHFTTEDQISDTPTANEEQLLNFFDDLNFEVRKNTGWLAEEEKQTLYYFISPPTTTNPSFPYSEVQKKGYLMSNLKIDYSRTDKNAKRRQQWNPSGRITVEEGVLSQIGSTNNILGVAGALVKVRKWGFLVIKTARTDVNGNFRASATRTRNVKYTVFFNYMPNFKIMAGTYFWSARHSDSRSYDRAGWFPHFADGENTNRGHFYSLIQNAAYDYYERIRFLYGLQKPRTWLTISARFDACNTSEFREHIIPFTSRIRITRRNSACTYRRSDGIYATTVHELTHSGHRQMDPGMFAIISWSETNPETLAFNWGEANKKIMRESWAEGVEIIATNERYLALEARYRSSDPRDENGLWGSFRQELTALQMSEYTPIVVDLIDNLNQNTIPNIDGDQPIDRVNGYTLQQIQTALNNCRTLECWELNLLRQNTNPTEDFLEELFGYTHIVRDNL